MIERRIKKSKKNKGHKNLHSKTRKNHRGGNLTLAYPLNNVSSIRNPALAYTGKGGNINNAYPAMGPPASGFNFLNPQVNQRGGCGCSNTNGSNLSVGGGKRKNCSMCDLKLWGGRKHRIGCKCSLCKNKMMGGTGNNGIPYPNGLVGSPWQPSPSGWPGVNDVSGDRNYLAYNTYPTDVQTSIIDSNSNPRGLVGGKTKKHRGKYKLHGGTLSNFFGQDLINVGRQFQFGLGSAYNALAGYSAPVNPMPWKDQLVNTPSLSTVKAASYY
jgi:hypothetical protein